LKRKTDHLGTLIWVVIKPWFLQRSARTFLIFASSCHRDISVSFFLTVATTQLEAGCGKRTTLETGSQPSVIRRDSNSQEAVIKFGDSVDSAGTFPAMDKEAVIDETVCLLADSLSPWAVAQRFENKKHYLDGRRPVDRLVAGQHDGVLEAARAFIQGTYLELLLGAGPLGARPAIGPDTVPVVLAPFDNYLRTCSRSATVA
jgi:hypothetical protein